ncbi:RNA polymerase sigma factor [Amycolatopsis sp. lyj-108]|uniref:RNA polymerase sigma factor n=1 Tax=Amycolatopsis sp. lyj-108 TaxID=2789286 RepID=UPI003979E707
MTGKTTVTDGGSDDDGGADNADGFENQVAIPYEMEALIAVRDIDVPAAIEFATKQLTDRGAAEEAVATAFSELTRKWRREGAMRNPRALLFKTTKLRITDERRRRQRHPVPCSDEALAAELERTVKGVQQTPELRGELFTDSKVIAALKQLPARQRQVLQLRYGDDLDLDDVAALMAETKPAEAVHL